MKQNHRMTRQLALVVVAVFSVGCGEGEPLGGEEAWAVTGSVEAVASALMYSTSIVGASVTFESYGEHLLVKDTKADGHSAVGQIEGCADCWNPNGNGSTKDCNFEIPEGVTIRFRACIGEYGPRVLLTCGEWRYANTAN